MEKTIFQNALIISMDDFRPAFFRGDILVQDDLIGALSETPYTINGGKNDRVIDGTKLIIMPGFINTHGHSAMSLLRSYADDLPLKTWLEKKIWPAEEFLTGDDVYWGTLLSITEMVRGGTTTFADMYFFMPRVAEAVEESGIRAVLSRGIIGLEDGGIKGLQETEAFIGEWNNRDRGRIKTTIGPHAPYTCPPECLRRVMALADKTGAGIQIHLSETKGETEDSYKYHGKSPVELVAELGLFDYPVTAAHCVHLSDNDIALLAEKKVGVAHNPGSNLKLGSGIARLTDMLKAGVKVGLGTDGPASNNNLDMIEEMRLAALIEKGLRLDPTAVNAVTALRMATSMGAEVLGLKNTGRLTEGFKADLIGIDLNKPHLTPLHDPLAHVVYAASSSDICYVMVDGVMLMEESILKKMDEEKIMAQASICAKRLISEGRPVN